MEEQTRPGMPRLLMAWVMAFALVVGCMMPSFAYADGKATATLGSQSTTFEEGTTYIVPISLMNANDPTHTQASAAAACPGKYGKLTVAGDGTATLQFETRGVTVGTLTDYAYNFKVHQGNSVSSDTVDATVVDTYSDIKSSKSRAIVPNHISIVIPDAMKSLDGVYLNMYVDAMGYAPDAWLQIDYAKAVKSGDPSLNYTKTGTGNVRQFGNYNVDVSLTVTDGVITDAMITGKDWEGSKVSDNKQYLNRAVTGIGVGDSDGHNLEDLDYGMRSLLIGKYDTDSSILNNLDTVSGATYSSNAIKEGAMNALGIEILKEEIPEAPTESIQPGYYSIELKDRTSVVDHGLVGEVAKSNGIGFDKKRAYLYVSDEGKMFLTYKFVSGTVKEPLHVLGFNGYYPDNDTSRGLSMDGVVYDMQEMEIPFGDQTLKDQGGENKVVTTVTMPLDSVRQTYLTNVYLYVNAMRNLGKDAPETVSGVTFDKGRFNIDSTITLYWDTLTPVAAPSSNTVLTVYGAGSYRTIDIASGSKDGTYALTGTMAQAADRANASMANGALNHKVKLSVEKGKPYLTLDLNGLTVGTLKAYLQKLSYYESGYTVSGGAISGTVTQGTVIDTQPSESGAAGYPNHVKIPLTKEALSNGGYVPLQLYVPAKAGFETQDVYLKLDLASLEAASDADFPETETFAQSISGKASFSKVYGDKPFSLGAKARGKLAYQSSNARVAAVDKSGKVTVKGAGTAKITVSAAATDGYKAASKTVTVKVAKAAQKLKAKASAKTLKAKSLKKKAKAVKAVAVKGAKGTLSYKKASGSKKLAVNAKTGKVTVKKGTKKGTYTAKVKVTAKATANYNAASKTVTVKVKVK